MMVAPTVILRPLGTKLWVRKAILPQFTAGGLEIPEAYRIDRSLQLWDVLAVGPKVEDWAGYQIGAGDMIQTWPWRGVYTGKNLEDQIGFATWIQDAEDIRGWWPNTWDRDGGV